MCQSLFPTGSTITLVGQGMANFGTKQGILCIVTGAEGGVGLPANLAIADTAIGTEAILMMRFQLQLVANLAKL